MSELATVSQPEQHGAVKHGALLLVPLIEANENVRPAFGNFIVSTTCFPELTLPIESVWPHADFGGLVDIVLTRASDPLSTAPILNNRIVNSGIYRVATQVMPGALTHFGPTRRRFTPHLEFVSKNGSAQPPTRKAVYLDLDEYQ